MSEIIVEDNNKFGTYYEIKNNKAELADKRIQIISLSIQKQGHNYHILYNSHMEPIPDVFGFINEELFHAPINTVLLSINALKLLYAYIEIFGLNLSSFTKRDASNLIYFLSGESFKGSLYTLNLKTQRSASTINSYLSVYRSYLNYLEISDSIFLKMSANVRYSYLPETETTLKLSSYEIKKKNYIPEISAPKYIRLEEFRSILKIIRSVSSLQAECIIRLMYECGLRIGEVLGLTNEDLVLEGEAAYIYIRNRFTDAAYQHAKSCMKISERSQYNKKAYQVNNVGFQKVRITSILYDKICQYINESHTSNRLCFKNNYLSYNQADSVVNPREKNFYIFINSTGRPLSRNMWNKTLRSISMKAGIQIDKNVRDSNLSHRYRHGYAMFMVKYKKVDQKQLQILLRHRSIRSVEYYFRPTDEDIGELKEELIRDMYEFLPELMI